MVSVYSFDADTNFAQWDDTEAHTIRYADGVGRDKERKGRNSESRWPPPRERQYIAAELIRDTSFTASEAKLKTRIGDLRDSGYTQFMVQIVPGQEDAIEDWGRIAKAFG
ncbi:MAG: hypothetical protein GKS00_17805 [Alphaproteobacteria bacterium]|nr:hypothetical protein [Alphaproteobacteria bacterium]